MLGQEFREEPKAVGLIDENTILEIFTSPAGTWTVIATDTEGVSCVLAAGEGWDDGFAATVANKGV